MSRTPVMIHDECIPPEDNPKGALKSIYYYPVSSQVGVKRIPDLKICDTCHKLVKILQEDMAWDAQ